MFSSKSYKLNFMITPEQLHAFIGGWITLAALVFLILFFVRAPYGRHARTGWGPEIPARAGWVLMECPSLLIILTLFITGSHQADPAAWIFMLLWSAHYTNRSFVYPFRCKIGAKKMPLLIAMLSVAFNGVNASINGIWLFELAPEYGTDWLLDPRFIIGLVGFLVGMTINIRSDNLLLKLREDGDGYSIPHGGLFRWISAPNYLGEIIEWLGFALMTWSLSGLAFAIWTIANLVPRAGSNHKWYHLRFPEYPKERKALIPFVY